MFFAQLMTLLYPRMVPYNKKNFAVKKLAQFKQLYFYLEIQPFNGANSNA
jgi:hypothetical protein